MATPGTYDPSKHRRDDDGKFANQPKYEAGGTGDLEGSQGGTVTARLTDPDDVEGGAYRSLHSHFQDVESSLDHDGADPGLKRAVMEEEVKDARAALDSIERQLEQGQIEQPEYQFAKRVGEFSDAEQKMVEDAHEETQRLFRDEFPDVAEYDLYPADSPDNPNGPMRFLTARREDGSEVEEDELAKISDRVEFSTLMLNQGNAWRWDHHDKSSDAFRYTFDVK